MVTRVGTAPSGPGGDSEADYEIVLVAVESLLPAHSPRMHGINEDHARLLAQSETPLPPILVQRHTMRVIDGMHRLRASQINGNGSIRARLLDDDDQAAYLRGVTANIRHGLPLSLAERRAAAIRLLEMYPHWSDRSLGQAAGLSGKTVGALRREMGDSMPARRTGQDGRVRSVNNASSRQVVTELLTQRPAASLREIARAAGVSPNTVRNIRQQVAREPGTGPDGKSVPPSMHLEEQVVAGPTPAAGHAILANLSRDPSLRYTEAGRTLLRQLHRHAGLSIDRQIIAALPPHCLPAVARLARTVAEQWSELADLLDGRAQVQGPTKLAR